MNNDDKNQARSHYQPIEMPFSAADHAIAAHCHPCLQHPSPGCSAAAVHMDQRATITDVMTQIIMIIIVILIMIVVVMVIAIAIMTLNP